MNQETALTNAMLECLRDRRRETHEHVLTIVGDLTDAQMAWRPVVHDTPPIGFHVWHLARWADHDAAFVAGRPQIWRSGGFVQAWGFPEGGLGEDDTGTGMGDDVSSDLVLPPKLALLDYTRSAFAALDEVLSGLDARALLRPPPPPSTSDNLIETLFGYLSHDNRHLGMIEALRGMLGLRGTATN